MFVVDAAPGYAAKGSEGSGMGIKQHLMRLQRVGHHQEGATVGQLDMGRLQSTSNAADHGVLAAPVELEGLTRGKPQGDEGFAGRRGTAGFAPLPDKDGHPGVATGITLRLQQLEQYLCGAPVTLGAVTVRAQPGRQLFFVRVQDAGGRCGEDTRVRASRFDAASV